MGTEDHEAPGRLFRREVIEHQQSSVWGDVLLVQPISHSLLTLFGVGSVIIICAFLYFGEYARRVTINGYLSPDKGVIKIYAPRVGVIEKLSVRPGEVVKKDQALMTLSSRQDLESGGDVDALALEDIEAQIAAIAQREEQTKTRAVVDTRHLEQQIESLRAEAEQIAAQVKLQKRRVAIARERFESIQRVQKRGLAATTDAQLGQEAYLEQVHELQLIEQRATAVENSIRDAEYRLATIPTELADRLADFAAQRSALQQNRSATAGRRKFLIRAPQDGTVSALQATAGRTVQPSYPLVAILPKDSELKAELFVPTRAIGFVRENQNVKIRYEAFPYQRYGTFAGSISAVNRVILAPDELPIPVELTEPVYQITATLERQAVKGYGEQWPLQAGMLLEADIILEKRSLVDWLLDPLYSLRGRL